MQFVVVVVFIGKKCVQVCRLAQLTLLYALLILIHQVMHLKKKKLENARKIYTQPPPQITKQTEQVQNTGHLLRIYFTYISGDIIGR